jgi:arylsulfatase A-like enzyme
MIPLAIALLSAPARPNIIFILADDIGYGDLSCYGATKLQTPNLDRLAQRGIQFVDAHSPASVCTPTRYSLLSGEYSFRRPGGAGILSGLSPLAFAKDQDTLPKMLKAEGYRTAVFGKWHLGLGETRTDYNQPITAGPKEVGFDESLVIPATGDRVPCVFVENGKVANYDPKDPIQVSYQEKIGDWPTGKENPELLRVKPLSGHFDTIINGVSRMGFMTGGKKALWVDEDISDRITKRALQFISKKKKEPFFLYFPTHSIHAPQLPNPRFKGTTQCGHRGDTIRELDAAVGEIVKAVDRAKLTNNTIIIFSSDNGGADQDGYIYDDDNLNGHRFNGALRGTKYGLYEGGHRVPMIISWPAKSPLGQKCSALVTMTDFYKSFAQELGLTLPVKAAPDSLDTSSAFFKGTSMGRQRLIIHTGGFNSPLAYREGKYVLVPKGKQWELYDLEADISQTTDLAKQLPEKVKELLEHFEQEKQLRR